MNASGSHFPSRKPYVGGSGGRLVSTHLGVYGWKITLAW